MTHESKAWQKSLVGMYGRIWVAFTDRGPFLRSSLSYLEMKRLYRGLGMRERRC
jgi:hypothetical protein